MQPGKMIQVYRPLPGQTEQSSQILTTAPAEVIDDRLNKQSGKNSLNFGALQSQLSSNNAREFIDSQQTITIQ